jgi:hypothetical protein
MLHVMIWDLDVQVIAPLKNQTIKLPNSGSCDLKSRLFSCCTFKTECCNALTVAFARQTLPLNLDPFRRVNMLQCRQSRGLVERCSRPPRLKLRTAVVPPELPVFNRIRRMLVMVAVPKTPRRINPYFVPVRSTALRERVKRNVRPLKNTYSMH